MRTAGLVLDKPEDDEPQEAASLSAQTWIALIHKSPGSCWGVSFPDLPGIITAADTLEEALSRAAEVLAFAFEDWQPPAPRGLEELRLDAGFVKWSAGAFVAEVLGISGEADPLIQKYAQRAHLEGRRAVSSKI
jgi:antitoxin HicB